MLALLVQTNLFELVIFVQVNLLVLVMFSQVNLFALAIFIQVNLFVVVMIIQINLFVPVLFVQVNLFVVVIIMKKNLFVTVMFVQVNLFVLVMFVQVNLFVPVMFVQTLHEKPYFFFKCSEKMVFPKTSHWNMIFLVLSGKMIFIFSENIILFFRRKMKDDLSQKKYMEIWYFLQMPEKDDLFQKISRWNMVFLVLSGKIVFFSRKYDSFSLDGKWKMIFLKKYMEVWYFLHICINITNMILPFCKKKSTMIFSRKNTLKCEWHSRLHSRKNSNDSLCFYGDLHERFHILLSCEKKTKKQKKPGDLIFRIEIWLLLHFISLDIFYNEESSILCTIQPSGVVFRGVLEHQLRKLFVH